MTCRPESSFWWPERLLNPLPLARVHIFSEKITIFSLFFVKWDLFLVKDNFRFFLCQVNGQRLVYKFVKPPLGKESSPSREVPSETQAPIGEDKVKAEEPADGNSESPSVPCVRTNAGTVPQNTLTTTSMGFRIIQAPLVAPGQMTYPLSLYPYLVPCVIPACRQFGVIKS